MTSTVIREAAPADAAALAGLRWEFRSGRTDPTEAREVFVARCTEWMRVRLDRGEWRAWVAEDAGDVVGNVWVHAIDKIPNPVGERERHAYLSNLYVRPSARGGTGTRLLEAAIAWASAGGVDTLLLWPTDRSRTLYARHGFVLSGDFLARRF
ncbi:MAG: N-acetyltransferase family protein [Betaproteobacteria bacterium]